MTVHPCHPSRSLLVSWCVLALAAPAAAVEPAGKSKPKPPNPAELKRLDAELEEIRTSFLRDTTALIFSYEKVGEFERARLLLEALQKLDSKNEAIRTKLAELQERILQQGEFEITLEPGDDWLAVGAVVKDRPLRIEAEGEYKLTLTVPAVGPTGMGSTDPADSLATALPFGAVVAVIVPATTAAASADGRNDRQKERPPKPFLVGLRHEQAADRDGILYLRVNLPAGTKGIGKFTVRVSGPERPAEK